MNFVFAIMTTFCSFYSFSQYKATDEDGWFWAGIWSACVVVHQISDGFRYLNGEKP